MEYAMSPRTQPIAGIRTIKCMCLAVILSSPVAIAAEGTAPRLRLSRTLQEDSLSQVIGQEAAAAISAGLIQLYDTGSSAADRLAAAEKVNAALVEESAAPVRSEISRRVALLQAGLNAQTTSDLSDEQRQQIETIVAAADSWENRCSQEDADAARAAWGGLRNNEAVMEHLRPVFMTQYFNHNMHVTVSESLLASFVREYQTRNGTIAECILGAWVTGSQATNAHVSADIKRSTDQGHFILRLNGQVTSNTRGRKSPATIFTRGRHSFVIDTPVFFNGETLTSGEASIDVNINNQTVGVKTDYDWIPLFGSLARKIARQKAAEKRGQTEYIAAQKITKQALPEFVKETNERFAEANTSIQRDLFDGLNSKGVGPDSISSRSSESHLAVSSRTMGGQRLGGSIQPFAPLPQGVAIQLHESAINNLIDGLEWGGRSVPEDQFAEILSGAVSDLFQRDIKLGGDKEEETADEEPDKQVTFVFSETDPVRVRLEENTLVAFIQVSVHEEGEEPIVPHRIRIPFAFSLTSDGILISPPQKVTAIQATALENVGRAKRAAMSRQIGRILMKRLEPKTVDGTVDVKASDTKTIPLNTVGLSSHDGWLTIELQ